MHDANCYKYLFDSFSVSCQLNIFLSLNRLNDPYASCLIVRAARKKISVCTPRESVYPPSVSYGDAD